MARNLVAPAPGEEAQDRFSLLESKSVASATPCLRAERLGQRLIENRVTDEVHLDVMGSIEVPFEREEDSDAVSSRHQLS